MGLPGVILFTLFCMHVIQISNCQKTGFAITSITSPAAAQLNVKWTAYPGATYYFLDLRVLNSNTIAPVAIMVPGTAITKLVQGLRAGSDYNVTVKATTGINYNVVASAWKLATTVPGSPQIIQADASSSSSISVQWSSSPGTSYYILQVVSISTTQRLNLTANSLAYTVVSLQSSTSYSLSVYAVNEAGASAPSKVKSVTTLVHPPKNVIVNQINASAVVIGWEPVDKVLVYGISIYKNGDLTKAPVTLQTSSTNIVINEIFPCTQYIFGLRSANNFMVFGEEIYTRFLTGNLNPVSGIQTKYNCAGGFVLVTWQPSFGASSYKVSAVQQNGSTFTCTSETTRCLMYGLTCGKTLTVRVTATLNNCESNVNSVAVFETGPCAPSNLSFYRDCYSNAVIFSWNASLYAAYYSAIAVASNGTVVECRTVDTSCFFTNFTCGMGYVLTVSAYNSYCNSNRSASIRVQTAPCEPHNVKIRADCQMDMLVAQWDYAAGALSYTIEATSNNGQQYNCSSFMNSCVIPEVNCGESLNAWIIASDDECNNSKALSEVVETVPCSPSVIKADAGCTADSISVFWADTNGAVTYITTAEGSDGEHSFCTSSHNNCHLTDLPCGQSYNISVIASNSKCNSSRSNTVFAYTAPCQPTYPNVFVDCITNQVLVMWEQSQGSSSYKAILQGSNGQNLTCNATLDNCQIQNLPCGQQYNVSVIGQDGICTSPPSDSVLISSVPCGPEHIEADTDCLTGIVTVLWDASEGAHMYSAIAESVNGTQNVCNSTDTNCIMAGLECGQPYMISVRSSSGNCQSMPSKEVLIQQVPCLPQKVKSQPTCPGSSLTLSWAPSVGASSYTAAAWEEDQLVLCSSTEPSCEFQDLKCGWTYHINVTATGGNCTSAPSLVHSIQTAPCPPKEVTSQIDYTTNIVTLEWQPGRHANTYTATAIGNYGHVTSCQSTNSSCQFKDLRCGEKYNFSIIATDGNCDSIQVMVPEQETAPCIPQNMGIILDCDTNIALASWDRSKGALGYTAMAQDVNGKIYTWNTTDTSCSMAHLQCGLQHSITVKALSANSNSAISNVTTFQTVPCVPLNVQGNLECSTNVWNVSWVQSPGAIFYSLRLSGPNNDTRTFSSENASFSIGDLLCAEDYSVTVSAIGRQCNSSDSYSTFIKTVPCTPLNIETHLDCSTNIPSVTWDHSKGAMSYRAIAESSTGHTTSCNTSDNNCDISFLQCGQKYNISVVAEDNKCGGFRSSFTEIETAPCPPENVAAVMDCNNKTATVSWSASERAVSYNVSAEENGEQISSCSTQDTSCHLSDLQCGRTYDVTVTPIGRGCTGFKSSAFKLFTGPCPPMNVEVKFDCLTKFGSVSWDLEPGAQVYVATATEDDGHTHTCTTNSTECVFMDLHCGSIYIVTAVAINGECSSANSLGSQIKTAPCTPEIADVQLYCEGNLISVLWDQTEGARSYVLSVDSPDGKTASLVTNDTSQDVVHLQCGTIYMFWLTAQGEMCNTSMMHSVKRETAPCPPRNVQAEMDCGLNTGNITWEKSNGAQSYIAVAEGVHGHLTSCNSIGTSCDMKLDCGQLYRITVVAANNNCNSSNEKSINIASAPCLPQNVQAELDCSSNSLSVQWQQSSGAESYTAMAIGSNGVTATCNTTDTTCNISSLECGLTYSIAVTSSSLKCNIIKGSDYKIQSAPCMPEGISTQLDCATNIIAVSWNSSKGAISYMVIAETSDGKAINCTSSGTACELLGAQCGDIYSITVHAADNKCSSLKSPEMFMKTVPCVPEHLNYNLDCETNIAMVRWDYSMGSLWYVVEAKGKSNHSTNCSSQDTNCNLSDFLCGQTYTVTVTAEDSTCRSAPSSAIDIKAAPCKPHIISTHLDCVANSIFVNWETSDGATFYLLNAEEYGGSVNSFNTTESHYDLMGLNCGQKYFIRVVASDDACASSESLVEEVVSAPCVPENITTSVDCFSDSATISWYLSAGADFYTARMLSSSQHSAHCQTNDTSCIIPGLQCGQIYEVGVVAHDQRCNSTGLLLNNLQTEPCMPQNVHAIYSANMAEVGWDHSLGAGSYTAEALSILGHWENCETTDTRCKIEGLLCGEIYNVTVSAHNDVCNSTISEVKVIETEPCPPQNVVVDVDCEDGLVSVSWEESANTESYIVTAEKDNVLRAMCHISGTSCHIPDLECGQVYALSVRAQNAQGNSSESSVVYINTAPCLPAEFDAVLNCNNNNTAWAFWSPSHGAEYYTVSAQGADGQSVSCNTTDSSCNLTDLHCGEMYNLSMIVSDEQCQRFYSVHTTVTTVPCIPFHISADLSCDNQTALVTWDASEGAESYHVTAWTDSGDSRECHSTGLACDIRNLQCGQTYHVAAVAVGSECRSEQSPPEEIQTAPCIPQNLQASFTCGSDAVSAVWEESPGAEVYIVTVMGANGQVVSFNTTDTGLEIMDLFCGQTYNMSVRAQNEICSSAENTSVEFQTTPCIPQDVSTTSDCLKNHGLVYWTESDGAVFYTAIAQGLDGHQHICNTEETSCNWTDLHCGEVYNVFVMAHDYSCNSSVSNTSTIVTGPCTPQNFGASAHCSLNGILVSWDASEGAAEYQVTAQDANGFTAESRSNITSCDLTELPCGEIYSATVTALSNNCLSPPSSKVYFKTGPCPPIAVSVQPDCSGNSSLVRWTESNGALYYMATAETTDDTKRFCTSVGTQCEINGLQCGQLYYINVVAVDYQCNSTEVPFTEVQTAPCRPQNVSVQIDCATNSSLVSWVHAAGAINYTATAQSNSGKVYSCTTDGQECELQNLPCGQLYMVQVVAMDNTCSSLPSTAVNIQTAPCVPKISEVFLDCLNNTFLVQWSQSEGAIDYTVTATAPNEHIVGCSSNSTNCEIGDLMCSQLYSIRVMAFDDQCNSSESTSWYMETVPCVPQIVQTRLDCNKKGAFVQWNPVDGAQLYVVNATSNQGDEATCTTNKNFCEMTELQCGSIYNVSVTAANQLCDTSQSEPEELKSAPCVPGYVTATNDCDTGTVTVSWEESSGATFYTVMAHGSRGYLTTCNATGTECQLTDLLCSHSYNITVTATDDMCTSLESHPVTLDTVLCAPQQVTGKLLCDTKAGLVSWMNEEGANLYSVMAVGPDGHMTQCNTTLSSCELTNLHCGQFYNFTVTALDGVCDNAQSSSELPAPLCAPQNVEAFLECSSNTAYVSWEMTTGAAAYVVFANSSNNYDVSCNTTDTFCMLHDLHCGEKYNVTVLALDNICDNIYSASVEIRTGPCPPENVVADIDCYTGIMSVRWDSVPGATFYAVQATAGEDNSFSCNGTDTTCGITGLPCGLSLTVTTTSSYDDCQSTPSQESLIATAPCTPLNVKGYLDCVTNAAWVSWSQADGAEIYNVTAISSGGHQSSCTSTNVTCGVPDLQCGNKYTFSVTAISKDCLSMPSAPFDLETAPCILNGLTLLNQCNSSTINVLWNRTESSQLYIATAEGSDGSMYTCNSTKEGCNLNSVNCGTEYTIIVAATSDKCSSLRSPPSKITTAPCIPTDVRAFTDCQSGVMNVSWSSSPFAEFYMATIMGVNGAQTSCNTSGTTCTFADLVCGQTYEVSVTASHERCRSPPNLAISVNTVPCAPEGLNIDMQCESSSALLSWMKNDEILEYYASATLADGEILWCTTQWTGCTINELACGSSYNFALVGFDGTCNSSFSNPITQGAVPCPPENVTMSLGPMTKSTQELQAVWSEVQCAEEYMLEVHGLITGDPESQFLLTSYWTTDPYFYIPLLCSSVYNVSMISRNVAGIGDSSVPVQGLTAPCTPNGITVDSVVDGLVVVSWNASIFATEYWLLTPDDSTLCKTSQLSCELPINISSSAKLVAVNSAGESEPSESISLTSSHMQRKRRDLHEESEEINGELLPPQLHVLSITNDTLHVEWTATEGATHYLLIVKEVTASKPFKPIVQSVQETSAKVSGLQPFTNYKVVVSAKDSTRSSAYSDPVFITTDVSLPVRSSAQL